MAHASARFTMLHRKATHRRHHFNIELCCMCEGKNDIKKLWSWDGRWAHFFCVLLYQKGKHMVAKEFPREPLKKRAFVNTSSSEDEAPLFRNTPCRVAAS